MSVRAELCPPGVETCYIRRLGRDDLTRRRVHDDRTDVGADALRVEVVEGDGPHRLRWDALLEEAHLRLLRVGVPVVAGDLDRLVARDVAPGGTAPARDDAREDEGQGKQRAAE